jgi:rod shape determining protein RodA
MFLAANVAMGAIAMPLWTRLAPYQQNRLLTFLNPEVDPRAAGYHAIQSRVAIGSGGWFGTGYTDGPQKRLAFLPEQHTDFVFSVVGEELGFLGVFVALSLFLTLFLILVRIARRAPDPFSSLVVFGIVGLFFTHVFENVGMTVNLMPITGMVDRSLLSACYVSVWRSGWRTTRGHLAIPIHDNNLTSRP